MPPWPVRHPSAVSSVLPRATNDPSSGPWRHAQIHTYKRGLAGPRRGASRGKEIGVSNPASLTLIAVESAETATIVPMSYRCSPSHLIVARCPRCCAERSSGATSVGCDDGDGPAFRCAWVGTWPESADQARSSPKYSTSSLLRSTRCSTDLDLSEAGPSSTQSFHPGGGGGHDGSGDQSGGGTQPSGGLGQFGGGL